MRTPHGIDEATKLTEEIIQAELAIRAHDGNLAEVTRPLQAAMTAAKAQHRRATEPHREIIRESKTALMKWYRRNLHRYGIGRAIKLPPAVLDAYLSSKWRVEITGEEQAVIRQVADKGSRFLTVTVTLNRDTIAAERRLFADIEGLQVVLEDYFRIDSELLKSTSAPKPSRLTEVLRTYTNPVRKPKGLRKP